MSNRHKIHILALLNYFKTVEKVEQKIAYHKNKLKLRLKNGILYDIFFKYIHICSMGASSVSREKVKRGGGGMGRMGLGGEGCMLCCVSL